MDDFEEFTKDRIAKLRAEVEALERTLKDYVSARARMSGQQRRSGGDQPRSGAFGIIMDAIAAAGPRGMSIDDMIEAAESEGFTVKRNTLRGQIWQAKNNGELEALEAGRYRRAGSDPVRRQSDEPSFSSGGFQREVKASMRAPEADLDDEIPF